MKSKTALIAMTLILGMTPTVQSNHHEDALELEQLAHAFGWDLEGAEIETQRVAEGLYVLFGVGGNIAASIGEDGVLIVDDQLPQVIDKIEAAIQRVGGSAVNYAINTHWHFDHAEGNNVLGPKGTTIVAHSNARADMAKGGLVNMVIAKYNQQPYPAKALPVLTFDEGMQIHFNDGQIDLKHFAPAHTSGDTVVIFKKQNAVHLGDVFNNAGYPFIDVGSGGSIDGMIQFCEDTLKLTSQDTIVIPGHGPVTDTAALRRYVTMLKTVRSRVSNLIEDGKTLQQVIDAKLTADFDEVYGPESNSLGFVNRVYTSLNQSL
ncbi:MBL fold metallo-hydrolase [Gammaproteobacteria bacterium]|nr:MBL fold metallo-hydrolase [bacterium]MDA9340511.1 MBL fold metallo-hydrolase [Gammaproteobacteria bacterium]MDA9370672.1 MBL fold metallo-hydrolase [Gammaproteobacteria bacterium]MDB4210076.1 MBL fold metallo-hydrolase [Gammaproteobacteria bacterium]MDB9700681.1 MBL fold metallo-hydrolase [Gammaproteobacteria bacterium]|tara:strand:- start:1532 stop:2488 length:957 start_codon:yes stop_codon:yes gene_type:complete